MQIVIPFNIQIAASPAGNNGQFKISSGSLPWAGRTRMKIITNGAAAVFVYWGTPDMSKTDMVADIARFGSSGSGDNNSGPTFDWMTGGGFAGLPEWMECPAGGFGNLILFSSANAVGVLVFEPMPPEHLCCPKCGHRIVP